MPISIEEFVKQITEFGLVRAEELSALSDSLPPDARPKDAEQWAKHLVQTGKLTRYQASNAFRGKAKGLVFGEYVVLDKLGAGGMGQVFKAQHRRMKRQVALKALPPSATQGDGVKRFYQEVQTAALLTHPNIVTAYDAGEAHGLHFLIMEFVEGQDLASVVKQRGPLPIEQATHCILQAARGLEYAHKQNVIHRDIKPANLLLDKQGNVKILDMGLARVNNSVAGVDAAANEGLTHSGQVMGTVDYMAPEQAQDTRSADARADIYSLGCTFYRLLIGEVPYKADTLIKKILAHREQPVPSLSNARPEVPARIDAICKKMLAKRPENRYQTMSELIADLEKCDTDAADVAAGLVTDDEPVHGSGIGSSLSGLDSPGSILRKRGADDELGLDASRSRGSGSLGSGSRSGSRRGRAKAVEKKPPPKWLLVGGGAGAGLLVLVVALVFFLAGGKEEPSATEKNPPADLVAKTSDGKPPEPTKSPVEPPKSTAKPATPPASVPSVPVMTASAPVGKPIDLLVGLQPSDQVEGRWQLKDGKLLTPVGGRLLLPGIPPTDYMLTTVVRRVAGVDAFGLGLKVGPSQPVLIIDGYGGKAALLEKLDGKKHPNETSRSGPLLGDIQPHTLVCEVHPDSVKLAVDGKTIFDWHGDAKRLALDSVWSVPDGKRLFVGSWQSAFEIAKLELLPLPPTKPSTTTVVSTPAAKPPVATTPTAKPTVAPSSPPPSAAGPAVNLLTKVDPQNDGVSQGWTIQNGKAVSTSERGNSTLQVSFEPPADYLLTAVVRRLKGSDSFDIGLPIGSSRVAARFDAWHSTISGLGSIDGKNANDNETKHEVAIFVDNQPHTIVCTVHPNSVKATVDGKLIIDWSGDAGRLTSNTPVPNKRLLFLASVSNSSYEVTKLELLPLVSTAKPGTATPTTPAPTQLTGPVDLLKLVQLPRDIHTGTWKIEDGALEVTAMGDPSVYIPFAPPESYDITLTVEGSLAGIRTVLGLNVQGHPAAFYWMPSVPRAEVGLRAVEPTGLATRAMPMQSQQASKATFVAAVRGNRIYVTVDGTPCLDWSGDSSILQEYNNIGHGAGSRLFVGCNPGTDKSVRFTRCEIRPPTILLPSYHRVELLAPLDADQVESNPKAKLNHGDLLVEPVDGATGTRVPIDAGERPSEYVLTALVERTAGTLELGLGLPVANHRGGVTIDASGGDVRLGSQTARAGWLLTPWRLHAVEVRLSRTSCQLSVDGRRILDYVPDPSNLSNPSELELPDARSFVLRSHPSTGFRFTSLELKPLDWQLRAVPATADVTKAVEALDTILAPARAKTATPQQKSQAAESLWRLAAGAKEDPAKHFAALQNSAGFAAQAGDFVLMCRAATDLGRGFAGDQTTWYSSLVADLFKSARTSAAKQKLAEAVYPQIDRAVALDAFDLAVALQTAALTAAKPPTSDLAKELKSRGNELRLAQMERASYLAAKSKLDGKPDGVSREAAARYFGLVKNDWTTAAELLKDSSDSLLLPIARGELNTIKDEAKSADHAEQLAAQGDHWWALYEKGEAPLKWLAMERAAGWYRLAAGQATGKTKVRLDQRRTILTQQRKQSGMAFVPRHPYDAVRIGDHWYKLCTSSVNWDAAVEFCRNAGGHLLTIESPAENQAIGEFLIERAGGEKGITWMGCSDVAKEGDWRWIDGTPVASTFNNWPSGQPDNGGGDADYGRIEAYITGGELKITWDDANKTTFPFICEWDY